jgi:hypothetical protein
MRPRRAAAGTTAIIALLVALALVVAVAVVAFAVVAFVSLSPPTGSSSPPLRWSSSSTSTSTSEQSTTASSGRGSITVESNITGGLQLTATIKPAYVPKGQNITVMAQVFNTLSSEVKVNATSMANPASGPCELGFLTGVRVYQGQYTMANLSNGTELLLYNPSLPWICPTLVSYQYSFAPNSDLVTRQNLARQVNESSILAGYWTGSGQRYAFQPFLPGICTVEVFDAWGQHAVGHFQVSGMSLQSFSLCPSNCVYPSPYLTGQIYFGGPSFAKSLELFVNGTDEGSLGHGIGNANVIYQYKGSFQSPAVVAGEAYVIKFVAVFEDNSTATATTTVVAR